MRRDSSAPRSSVSVGTIANNMTRPEPRQASSAYWIQHAAAHAGTAAVHPNKRWGRYHAWTRTMLQTWTVQRLRANRERYGRVLDIGCGIGDWTEQFAAFSDEVYACDVAPAFVERTQARVPNAKVEC